MDGSKYSSKTLDLLDAGVIARYLGLKMIVLAVLLSLVAGSFWYAVIDPGGLPENMRRVAEIPGVKLLPGFALMIVIMLALKSLRRNKTAQARSFYSDLKAILLTPRRFFDAMPTKEGLVDPLLFGVICASCYGTLYGLMWLSMGQKGASALLFGTLLAFLLFSFLTAGICYLVMRALRSAPKGSFEAVLRVVLYSFGASTMLFFVPLLAVLSFVYGPVLVFAGLKSVYSATSAKAALAVAVSVSICTVFAVLLWPLVMMLPGVKG